MLTNETSPIAGAFTVARDDAGRFTVTVQTAAGPQVLVGGYGETRDALTAALREVIPGDADLAAMKERAWNRLVEATRRSLDREAVAELGLTVGAAVDEITAFTYRCDEYENGWFPTDITVDSPTFGSDVNLDCEAVVPLDTSWADEADEPDTYGELLDITWDDGFTRGWRLRIERPAAQ